MKRPADYFVSQADEARVTRVWSGVDVRLARVERRRPWLQGSALLLLTAAAIGLLLLSPRGWLRPRAPAEPQTLQLADGSRVVHAAGDHVEILAVTPERIELRMTRGRAHFEVTPNRARSFLTHAGDYTIRVVGTAYTVDLGASAVQVDVAHGEVEVRRDGSGALWRVRGGERWKSSDPPPLMAANPVEQRPPEPHPVPEPAPQLRAAEPEPKPAGPQNRHSGEAAQLFQRAQSAQAAGDTAECERLLSELVRRFPRDARTGLAAFQLGRVRLELGDARGALSAFDRAARDLGSFEEQIEARRIEALELLGEQGACRSARDAFLRAYPRGSFTGVVRRRCP